MVSNGKRKSKAENTTCTEYFIRHGAILPCKCGWRDDFFKRPDEFSLLLKRRELRNIIHLWERGLSLSIRMERCEVYPDLRTVLIIRGSTSSAYSGTISSYH